MSVSLATVATQFLERPGLAQSTQRSYEETLMPLLKEYGRWSIEIVDRKILSEYLNGLTHLSYTTHHRHQAILQALFNFAVEQGYIKANPLARLKRKKPDPKKGEHSTDQVIRYLTSNQIQLVYQAVASHSRMNALVRLLHRSGARIGEVLGLDLEGVDRVNYKFSVVGKGNKQRWCFYSEDAAIALEHYLKYYRHKASVKALFTAQHPVTGQVTRLSYRTVHKDWKELIQEYPSLQGIRLHDLRHTFATERVGLMSLEELRALMGHQNIQTTLRYQKVTSSRAESVAKQALYHLVKNDN